MKALVTDELILKIAALRAEGLTYAECDDWLGLETAERGTPHRDRKDSYRIMRTVKGKFAEETAAPAA